MAIASIVIPVHNRESLISGSIESAINQTIDDIEIIISDNCSDDSTYEVAKRYCSIDSRVKVYRNDKNIGPVLNWKKCVEYSRSPFCKILFSDDVIAPTFLERTLPALQDPAVGFSFTSACIGGEPWDGYIAYNSFNGETCIRRGPFVRISLTTPHVFPVSPGAALFRTNDIHINLKTQLEGIHNYDFCKTGAGVDLLLLLLTALSYEKVHYIEDSLAFFREHNGSITVKNENNSVDLGYRIARSWLSEKLGLKFSD